MAKTLDFEALWPFDLGRFGTTKGNAPCFLEVAAFLKTGEFDDRALDNESGVLIDFIMGLQDAMPDRPRQKLKRFIPRFIGCADFSSELARRKYIMHQALWAWLPLALDAAGMKGLSDRFRYGACGIEEFLCEARECELPIIEEIVYAALHVWSERSSDAVIEACTELFGEIAKLNDDVIRQLCLANDAEVGRVPRIYGAATVTINGALKLGLQGSGLDPWVVREAAERFREAIATSAST